MSDLAADKSRFLRSTVLLGLLFAVVQIGAAQQAVQKVPLPANVKEEKLSSELMDRDMPYRVILPNGYDKNVPSRYPVIYLLHGLTGHYDNWTDRTKLSDYAASYNFIIITPEGENGWYTDSATKPGNKYESYIVKELIPEIDKRFRTKSDRNNRVIAGLSMGGFGALKFGIKYPNLFSMAGSFSGAVMAIPYRTVEELPQGVMRTAALAAFGEPGSATQAANDLFKMIHEATPETIKSMPFLYIDCGTEDFLFQDNRDFINLLLEKKVPHEYRQLPGAHNWKYWDKQVKEFLEVANGAFSAK